MEDVDLIKINQAIVAALKENSQVTPNLTKIGGTLIVAGILWIGNSISEIKEEQALNGDWRKSSKIESVSFREFMAKPRFTRSDFTLSVEPILHRLKIAEVKLDERRVTVDQAKDAVKSIDDIKDKLDRNGIK